MKETLQIREVGKRVHRRGKRDRKKKPQKEYKERKTTELYTDMTNK